MLRFSLRRAQRSNCHGGVTDCPQKQHMRDRLDPLIAERASWLFATSPLSLLARGVAERLLAYDDTLRIAKGLQHLGAADIMATMGTTIARHVSVQGLRNIPETGPTLVVANHPTGIADGIILYHVLSSVRPDIFIYANADVLRVLPQLGDVVVPVEWRKTQRTHAKTRETMKQTAKALERGKMGIIFPSGRLAKRRGLHLFEREWMPSAAMIARKFDIPVIPVHISARNSWLFYLLDVIHPTLRDITLFYETLNKDRQSFDINIGPAILPDQHHANSHAAIDRLRGATMTLGNNTSHSVPLLGASRSQRKPSLTKVKPDFWHALWRQN